MPWKKNKGGGYSKKGAAKGKGGNIKNPEQYEALRDKGMPKSKAAKISNSKSKGKKS